MVTDSLSNEGGGNTTHYTSYKDIIYEFMPYYLSIGMSADEYLYKDVELARIYRKMDKIRNKRTNQELWASGLYIRMAVASVLSEKVDYPKEPYPLTKDESDEKKQIEKQKRFENYFKFLKSISKKGV